MAMQTTDINTSRLLRNPKMLHRVVRDALKSSSPTRVAKQFARHGITSRAILRRTGINLKTLAIKRPTVRSAEPKEKPLPPLRQLQAKYRNFNKNYKIYENALQAYWTIGHMLTAAEFRDSGAASIYGFQDYSRWDSPENKAEVGRPNTTEARYIDVTPNYVETRVKLPDINISVGLGGGSEYNAAARQRVEAILKAFWSNFKLPDEWKEEVKKDEYGAENKHISVVGDDQDAFYSLEALARKRPAYNHLIDPTEKNGWKGPEFVTVDKDYIQYGFSQMTYFDMKLKLSDTDIRQSYYLTRDGKTSGKFDSLQRVEATIPIEITVIIRWPIEFALYATSAPSRSKFIPFMFYQYVSWHKAMFAGKRTRGGGFSVKAPERINHLGAIVDMIDEEVRQGKEVKPRTNEDNFLIMGAAEPSMTGTVVWIPPKMNNVPEYMSQIKSAYNPDTKGIETKNLKMHGVGLLSDWQNQKFTFVREDGIGGTGTADLSGLITLDLTGSVPLDSTTIHRDLTTPLAQDINAVKGFISVLERYLGGQFSDAKPKRQYFEYDYLKTIPGLETAYIRMHNISQVIDQLMTRSSSNCTWGNLGGVPFEVPEAPPQQEGNVLRLPSPDNVAYPVETGICKLVRIICEDALENFDQLPSPYSSKIDRDRYRLWLITHYADDHKKFAAEAKARLDRNMARGVDKEALDNIVLPNMPGIKVMMPHQVKVLNALSTVPDTSLIDVAVGGGKTIMSTADALRLIVDKKVQRALFIVPGPLVKSWINEILMYSQGKINPITITLQTIRRLQSIVSPDQSIKPNYDVLRKLITSAPPNTIFITNYKFLIADRSDLVYGNHQITRLYSAEFLRDMDFDFVGFDECHFAKNITSLQTQGASIVASSAKICRMLSGTIVSNTLTDLVGQVGIRNPAAFGNAQEFNSKYGLELSGSNVIEWRPKAAEEIHRDTLPYAQRETHKKQEWAFILPRLHEQFYPVQFTERQKEFYNAMLQEALEDIKEKNPKLWQKMHDGNEADSAAIEQGLATYFQNVEEFVYAPDANAAFMELEDLEDDDKVSPKMSKVVEILEKHFAEYLDESGKVTKPLSGHKVIIFSFRRETSKHVMRHLPARFRRVAVHYEAGDTGAIETFLKNDKVAIFVADEKSVGMGQNFQIADRLIRMECLWSPGDQEQAIGRIWRPAFREGSGRPEVFLDWIFTDMSLEVTKIGRLISKMCEKVKYDRIEDPYFVKYPFRLPNDLKAEISGVLPQVEQNLTAYDMLTNLKLIKMNTRTMLSFNNVNMLSEYFATYKLMNFWEEQEFDRQKNLGQQRLIEVPQSARVEIPGSKKLAYIPRVPGVDPQFHDPKDNMGYKPISIVQMESDVAQLDPDFDEESERHVQINAVNPGDLVDTEFGFGYVTKILQDDVWVDVKGLGEIKLPKATVWLITKPEAALKIKRELRLAGKQGLPRLPGVVVEEIRKAKVIHEKRQRVEEEEPSEEDQQRKIRKGIETPVIEDTEDKYNTEEVPINRDNQIEIFGEIIDGQVALTCFAEDKASKLLVDRFGFRNLDPYTAVRIRNYRVFDGVMSALRNSFQINSQFIANLDTYRQLLVNRRLNKAVASEYMNAIRFLNIGQHKRLKPDAVRPYPVVWGGKLFLCFDNQTTPAVMKVRRVLRAAHIPGMTSSDIMRQDQLHLAIFRSKQGAIATLHKIGGLVTVPNIDDTLHMLRMVSSATNIKEDKKSAKPSAIEETEERTIGKGRTARAPVDTKPKLERISEEKQIPKYFNENNKPKRALKPANMKIGEPEKSKPAQQPRIERTPAWQKIQEIKRAKQQRAERQERMRRNIKPGRNTGVKK